MKQNNGKTYWRSLGELQETPEFQEFLHREFPVAASEFPEGMSRRRWMELMGASLGLGGLAGCRWEAQKIAPFAIRPENRIPGKPEQFATSVELGGMPRHLLMTCYDGRPIKVEGNPDHPDSKGATDAFAQACILGLYDPDRSDTARELQGRDSFLRTWDEFDKYVEKRLQSLANVGGKGLAILVEPRSSCSRNAMLTQIRKRFPQVQLYSHATLSAPDEDITRSVFGSGFRVSLHLAAAKRIACFDADLLGIHPTAPRNAAGFASSREPSAGMSRLYAVESQFSVTGASADHRLPRKSVEIPALVARLEALVSDRLGQPPRTSAVATGDEEAEEFLLALAEDLVAHPGESLVVVGATQPAATRELALVLNERLGAIGTTLNLYAAPEMVETKSLAALVDAAEQGDIDTLFLFGGNPVYDAPGDLEVAAALVGIPHTIRCGVYEDETSAVCRWHVPLAHAFEGWDDVRSWEGNYCVAQPLIDPLLNGRSELEVLASMVGDSREMQQIVRDSIAASLGTELPQAAWQKLVHDGLLTSYEPAAVTPKVLEGYAYVAPELSAEVEVVFTPSSSTLDGCFANNGWLQETPDFLTKLTWDNAALVSPATAVDLNLEHGKFVKIAIADRHVEVPVYVMPGQARGSVGLALGYGRTKAGKVGGDFEQSVETVGFDVNPIRPSGTLIPRVATSVTITPLDREYKFATTQDHHAIDKVGMEEIARRVDDLVREGPLDVYLEHPDFVHHHSHHPEAVPLWEEPSYDGNAWGMAIDLNKCVGCNACTVACQAENNVPIVGKEQVAVGREMHWIRIDRYFTGDFENPEVTHQPVACHHCETAPCEQVCPVAATVHSNEGLNDMIYNRFIGTRYCGNNCPYKVRRFNFFNYNKDLEDGSRQLAQLVVNPEVTVRSRGVMEKCTYCVQRIQTVKIDAKTGRRAIADGEIKTACQQACPSNAIEFGDLNDAESKVAKLHKDNRAYGMLSELNVKPRTRYLARIRNPNRALVALDARYEGGHGGGANHGDEHHDHEGKPEAHDSEAGASHAAGEHA